MGFSFGLTFRDKHSLFTKEIANIRVIAHTNIINAKENKIMAEQKYRCALCGQVVTPLPDGSCPICGAPKEMLKPYIDEDEEQ